MRIIEFLMDNIFIVVIIFGALASLFGKSGSKKKPGQMPDFGGGGLPRSLFPQGDNGERDAEQPNPQQTVGHTVYRPQSEQERPSSSFYREDAEPSQTAPIQRVLQRAATSKERVPAAAELNYGGESTNVVSVRAEDLRKAVIWAEVLGPPRSKRPFRK